MQVINRPLPDRIFLLQSTHRTHQNTFTGHDVQKDAYHTDRFFISLPLQTIQSVKLS